MKNTCKFKTEKHRRKGQFTKVLIAEFIEVGKISEGMAWFNSPLAKCVGFAPEDLRELADFLELQKGELK